MNDLYIRKTGPNNIGVSVSPKGIFVGGYDLDEIAEKHNALVDKLLNLEKTNGL